MHQPLTHISIFVSEDLSKHAMLRSPTLTDEFVKAHHPLMQQFCKESIDPEFDMDPYPMLLEAYNAWSVLYSQLSRGDVIGMNFDFHTYSMRLAFNYYRRENTLILLGDLFPQEMMDNPFEFKLFKLRRVMHEGVLNRIH